MSSTLPIQPAGAPRATSGSWLVRVARRDDAAGIAAGVRKLLVELGGSPPAEAAMRAATQALLEDRAAGAILVAEADGAFVGLLAASWQTAIHVPGRYALIQDLWVDPPLRGMAIGRDLLAAFLELARERTITCVEVGLPRARFAGLRATEAFYLGNGFTQLGTRMRRMLP